MADRFVKEHARPARAQNHRHGACRRRDGLEVDQRLADGLFGDVAPPVALEQFVVPEPAAAAVRTLFATPVLLGDDTDVEAHQRTHVPCQRTVRPGHQDRFVGRCQADDHLADPRIPGARVGVDLPQQVDLGLGVQGRHRVPIVVQGGRLLALPRLYRALAPLRGNGARRAGCLQERRKHDLVGIGESGLVARHGPDPHALLLRMDAIADQPVFEHPGFVRQRLEIQVPGVDSRTHQAIQHPLQFLPAQSSRVQQLPFRGQQRITHRPFLSLSCRSLSAQLRAQPSVRSTSTASSPRAR